MHFFALLLACLVAFAAAAPGSGGDGWGHGGHGGHRCHAESKVTVTSTVTTYTSTATQTSTVGASTTIITTLTNTVPTTTTTTTTTFVVGTVSITSCAPTSTVAKRDYDKAPPAHCPHHPRSTVTVTKTTSLVATTSTTITTTGTATITDTTSTTTTSTQTITDTSTTSFNTIVAVPTFSIQVSSGDYAGNYLAVQAGSPNYAVDNTDLADSFTLTPDGLLTDVIPELDPAAEGNILTESSASYQLLAEAGGGSDNLVCSIGHNSDGTCPLICGDQASFYNFLYDCDGTVFFGPTVPADCSFFYGYVVGTAT